MPSYNYWALSVDIEEKSPFGILKLISSIPVIGEYNPCAILQGQAAHIEQSIPVCIGADSL